MNHFNFNSLLSQSIISNKINSVQIQLSQSKHAQSDPHNVKAHKSEEEDQKQRITSFENAETKVKNDSTKLYKHAAAQTSSLILTPKDPLNHVQTCICNAQNL